MSLGRSYSAGDQEEKVIKPYGHTAVLSAGGILLLVGWTGKGVSNVCMRTLH